MTSPVLKRPEGELGEDSSGERARHLQHEAHRAAGRLLALPVDQTRQRHAVEELHHEEEAPIAGAPEVRDVDDVLVADRGGRLRLLHEALHHVRVARHVAAQDLERHALAEHRVGDEVDDAHPAFADHLLDAVATVDDPAQERIDGRFLGRCLRGRRAVVGAEGDRLGEAGLALGANSHPGADESLADPSGLAASAAFSGNREITLRPPGGAPWRGRTTAPGRPLPDRDGRPGSAR